MPGERAGAVERESRVILAGVDENGYGPVLGPLVVSAAALSVPGGPGPDDCFRRLHSRPWESLAGAGGVTDSKRFFGAGSGASLRRLEETVLAFFLVQRGFLPPDAASLAGEVMINRAEGIPLPCTGGAGRGYCLESLGSGFPGGADLARVGETAGTISRLSREAGISWKPARCLVFCPALFPGTAGARRPGAPAWLARSSNKSDLVARAGVRLALSRAGEDNGGREPLCAVLGKVGGLGRYGPHLEAVNPGSSWRAMSEGAACSHYAFYGAPGADLFWLRGAEAASFAVSLASLFGKYLREVFMGGINRFFEPSVPGLPRASGYRDPVTRRFIAGTRQARKRAGIPDECFFRR